MSRPRRPGVWPARLQAMQRSSLYRGFMTLVILGLLVLAFFEHPASKEEADTEVRAIEWALLFILCLNAFIKAFVVQGTV